jgi:hypothetical protein
VTRPARHLAIEEALDSLPSSSAPDFATAFDSALALVLSHYEAEERAFPGPRFDKMRAQHAEARELGREAMESLRAGQAHDVERLSTRFAALVRHNMIEEERDVFPYYHQEI